MPWIHAPLRVRTEKRKTLRLLGSKLVRIHKELCESAPVGLPRLERWVETQAAKHTTPDGVVAAIRTRFWVRYKGIFLPAVAGAFP